MEAKKSLNTAVFIKLLQWAKQTKKDIKKKKKKGFYELHIRNRIVSGQFFWIVLLECNWLLSYLSLMGKAIDKVVPGKQQNSTPAKILKPL